MQFTTFRGLTLRAVVWGKDTQAAHRILALHGWLDNCATWDVFFERVFAADPDRFYVVALDFAGHGRSDHRHIEANYAVYNYVEDVVSVLDALEWPSFSLLGHSMGAAVASLVAAVVAPRVASLVAIEALGPIAQPVSALVDATTAIAVRRRKAEEKEKEEKDEGKRMAQFESKDAAVHVRMKTGLHFVSEPGTQRLVNRGVVKTETGKFVWSSDPVAVKNSPMRYSEADVHAFLDGIQCPVLNIYGDKGLYDWLKKKGFGNRASHVKNLKVVHMPGSHHLHLELSTVDAVVQSFLDFMNSTVLKLESKL